MKKIQITLLMSTLMMFLLSGCMYPDSEKTENKVPYEDQIQLVQNAVDEFRKDQGGLLPIKNNEATVPIYQKYPIDFNRLTGKYMSDPPGNAYESGGVFQYVLIDVETKPTVKIFDLRIVEVIQEYQLRISMYRDKNEYLPFKEQLEKDVFTLDYKKLGYEKRPIVKSPYSQAELGIVVNSKGEIFIDYTPDLMIALEEKKHNYKQGQDIRNLLTIDSLFVPAYSLPYTIDENNKPVFLNK